MNLATNHQKKILKMKMKFLDNSCKRIQHNPRIKIIGVRNLLPLQCDRVSDFSAVIEAEFVKKGKRKAILKNFLN